MTRGDTGEVVEEKDRFFRTRKGGTFLLGYPAPAFGVPVEAKSCAGGVCWRCCKGARNEYFEGHIMLLEGECFPHCKWR